MDDICEDAFKSDREIRVFGEDITTNNVTLTALSIELSESKSNNVSFMKVEELSTDCKNLLAVSNSCICYSVTQKKNLLRLIDTITGDKEILRGHESGVTDIKFSSIDNSVLASTDNGDVPNKAHTILWKKKDSGIIFEVVAQLQLRGVLLIPHPQYSHMWAISDGHNVGVFSSLRVNLKSPSQFAELSMSAHFDGETVTDVAFSSNSRIMVVALTSESSSPIKSHFQIYRISGSGELKGNESLSRVYDSSSISSDLGCIVAVLCIRNFLVTVSTDSADVSSADQELVGYKVRVWGGVQEQYDGTAPKILQTVVIQLPMFKSKIKSSALKNPLLECALQFELRNDKYLILSSRRSSFVACLAVAPVTSDASVLLPLYHVTYLNLKAPVVSMDVTSILGREHHSDEDGEHLEMSCYQEEASDQASIQQYHVLFRSLFDANKSIQSALSRQSGSSQGFTSLLGRDRAVSETSRGKTILDLLNNSSSSNSSNNNLSSLLSTPGVVSAPRLTAEEQSASLFATPAASSTSVVAGLSVGLSPSHFITPVQPANSNKIATKSVDAGSSSISPKNDALPSFLALEPVAKNTSILNMIRTNSSTSVKVDATPTVSPAVVESKPITSKGSAIGLASQLAESSKTASVPGNVKLEVSKQNDRKEEQLSAATGVSQTLNQKKTTVAAKTVSVSEELQPLQQLQQHTSDTSSQSSHPLSTVSTPVHSGQQQITASLSSSSIDLNGTPASMLSSLADIKQAVRLIAKSAVSKELLVAVKDEIIRETRTVVDRKHAEQAAGIKKTVELETKKAIETALSTGKWKQELSASIAEALQAELAPIIAQKVRESVKDTVRDTVKAALATSFRSAFDSTLVPAFQTGTERMFGQVQSAFEQGMGGMVEESRKTQQHNSRSTEMLESEIRGLTHTIHTLEATVLELSERVMTLSSGGSARGFAAVDEEEERVDPFVLLEKGLISEAMLRALEDKDVSTTISLLDRLTPVQINSKCSNLVRLCITQQLAADMSVNSPEEGIAKRVEWIKNLVLSLVSAPASSSSAADGSDPTYERSFKSTIQLVLESLQAAKRLVFENNGEDGMSAVPQSVGTDLQLLEFVIQSKL